jgi:hypothetical protein
MRKKLSLGLVVVAASLIPAALGAEPVNGPAPDAFERAVARSSQIATHPNDRTGMLGVGAVDRALVSPPDAVERAVAIRLAAAPTRPDDRAGARGPGVNAPSPDTAPLESGPVAFAWQDATIGAGAMLVALMLVAVVGLTIRRARVVPS